MTRSAVLGMGLSILVIMFAGCGGDQPSAVVAASPSETVEPSAEAQLERGEMLYFQCRACHSLDAGGPHKVGPNLYGVFGRKAGLADGFAYSEALTNADVIWTEEVMDAWLARPSDYLPGNRMVFVGIKDAQDRSSLIAYLQQETTND